MANVGWALIVAASLATGSEAPQSAARAAYWSGRSAKGEARRASFLRGIDAARSVLAKSPDDPEALLWLAANLGAEALERGKLRALPVIPKMVALLEQLDRVAPTFENAAAARTLGHLYAVAPPIISVGSSSKARVAFERALALAPDFPGNLALAADFFDDQGEEERAVVLARQCLLTLPHFFRDPEAAEWRAIAERIIEDDA
jgi:hypothetical protein